MSSFIGTIQRLATEITPWFLQGPNLGAFNESLGLVLDNTADTLRVGLELGQPYRCDASALPRLASDRKVTLYSGETDASKRFRLAHWLQIARYSGTHYGEMMNLQPYFLPGPLPMIQVVHQCGVPGAPSTWHKLSSTSEYSVTRGTAPWDWDSHFEKWSRWWAIVDCTGGYPFSRHHWGEPGLKWGAPGLVWGGTMSPQDAKALPALLRERKAAHSRLEYVILDFEGHFSPTMGSPPAGNWDQWANRWPHAAYLKGY